MSKVALQHNVRHLKKMANGRQILAMVKANAYGHGIRQVSKNLEGLVDYLGVVSIDEALAIRKVGVTTPIVIIEGASSQEETKIAADQHFEIVLHHHNQLEWLNNLSCSLNTWLMINTGMNHLGFRPDEVNKVYTQLNKNSSVNKVVLMSHLCCASIPSHHMNDEQIGVFNTLAKQYNISKSLCNSDAMTYFPNHYYDIVRPGRSLYGVSSNNQPSSSLKPVMTLRSVIITIRQVNTGESLGYDGAWVAKKTTRVAIVAMGYGDGYPLCEQSLPVLVKGQIFYTVGKTAMDRLAIDITDASDAIHIRDEVVLWGDGLPIETVSKASKRSAYELLCSVQNRVKFSWSEA